MDKIEHSTVSANGINIHVAAVGPRDAPAVLFLHGFPELWYSWRHQMISLSSLGYRCIAPDLRGFGDSDAPESPDEYTMLHVVGDVIGVMDAAGVGKVFLVGHDWGAIVAWSVCLFRPDRVTALVNTSVVFQPRNPGMKPVDMFKNLFGDDYYLCRFQVPGEAEEDFSRADTAKLIKTFLTGRSPKPPCIPKEVGFAGLSQRHVEMPAWLTEEDVAYYADKFSKKGFTGGLNYYRAMNKTWELTAAWNGAQIMVPVKFVVGDLDLTYHIPGVKQLLHEGGLKRFVPFLEEVVVMEDTAHFLQQEKPDEVTAHIYDFIKKF
ncbi:hypothetical protein MLD38_026368 [Melastoma candidum]|uniref:Uncharacterized protein n=1 Tax=Melastoma candidum TaxID=119954 RepID=A0ACB9P1L4_9MYRT|nr:hypothetical protein MLD38_026368 [Melastoma candidum]